jgi:hypothetical protein
MLSTKSAGLAGVIVSSAIAAVRFAFAWLARTLLRSSIEGDVLARLPEDIHLVAELAPPWKDASEVQRISTELGLQGFRSVGTFSIPELPGAALALFLDAKRSLYANVREHPRSGVWLDIVVRHDDGRVVTVTSQRRMRLDVPPNHEVVHMPGASTGALVARARVFGLREPRSALDPFTLPSIWERAYAESVLWRRRNGEGRSHAS